MHIAHFRFNITYLSCRDTLQKQLFSTWTFTVMELTVEALKADPHTRPDQILHCAFTIQKRLRKQSPVSVCMCRKRSLAPATPDSLLPVSSFPWLLSGNKIFFPHHFLERGENQINKRIKRIRVKEKHTLNYNLLYLSAPIRNNIKSFCSTSQQDFKRAPMTPSICIPTQPTAAPESH